MTTLVGVFKKSSRFSAKSHVDMLGTVIKITLAVDERSAFGPGTFGTLKVCSHLNARKAIQYDTNTYRYVIFAEQLHSVTEIAPKSRFLCVSRSPIRYGFCAVKKAIRSDSVNIAFKTFFFLLRYASGHTPDMYA